MIRPEVSDPAARRGHIIADLMASGIPCGSGSCPDMSQELALKPFGCSRDGELASAHALGERTLALQVDHTLDQNDMKRIADAVLRISL